jgi:glutamate-1-semialdehyde aminotransferase
MSAITEPCAGERQTALFVAPHVLDFVEPTSVVHVGCENDVWLHAFAECGVADGWGLVKPGTSISSPTISADRLLSCDVHVPFRCDRKFDLALYLDQAQHINPNTIRSTLDSLTRLAPVVLFTAAAPYQNGREGRAVNEQWPDYWLARFAEFDFALIPGLRERLWTNSQVDWRVAQNGMLLASRAFLERHPDMRANTADVRELPHCVVHPRMFLETIQRHHQNHAATVGEAVRLNHVHEELQTWARQLSEAQADLEIRLQQHEELQTWARQQSEAQADLEIRIRQIEDAERAEKRPSIFIRALRRAMRGIASLNGPATKPIEPSIHGTPAAPARPSDGASSVASGIVRRSPIPTGLVERPNLHGAEKQSGFAVRWINHNVPARLPADDRRTCWVTLENRGSHSLRPGEVWVAVLLDGQFACHLEMPAAIEPGARATLHGTIRTPMEIGDHYLLFELRSADSNPIQAVDPIRIQFEVFPRPDSATYALRDAALDRSIWSWHPGEQGICWSSGNSHYPIFASRSHGCRITDVDGQSFIDYLMGWGSALLGYAHESIQRAVADALHSGAVITLGHHLMLEVADQLRQMFPVAGGVSFGKNGSDACTAAARLARAHTGKPVVLTCGYHGWQDWYVEHRGFAPTAVPARTEPIGFAFEYGDLDQVKHLLQRHRGQVAGVMIEPGGCDTAVEPNQDADPGFLRSVAELARTEGALLIFDEIFTCFRYPKGSVQHATGVIPDLTCLGKGLSAGMPLAAVVGRVDIFQTSVSKIFFDPTFKGEVYSFAAARAALEFYRTHDVPSHVWTYGERLRAAVNEIAAAAGVRARMVGFPARLIVAFEHDDPRRVTLMRTLLQQELCKAGVLTYQNTMVPSWAHDDAAFAATCTAFASAFRVIADAEASDRFAEHLEIPPLPT